jgi:hypothetical protein
MPPNAVAYVGGKINKSNISNSILRMIISDSTTIPSGNDGDITLEEFETNVVELNKYQYLNDVFIQTMTSLTQLYSQGNFADLSMQFTTEVYRQLGIDLENQRDFTNIDLTDINYNSQTFESYINTFHDTLDGLERAYVQYDSLRELQLEKIHCDNILNNPENLVNYFMARYTGIGISELDTIVTTIQEPLLRPEYALYIQRHGLPIGGIFESEKMSAILIELNIDTETYALLL